METSKIAPQVQSQTKIIPTFSIKNQLSGNNAIVSENESSINNTHSEKLPDLPVTVADLQKAWKEYADKIKTENPHFYSIIANRTPSLTNNVEVNLELLGQSQEIELMKEKDKLFDFLKNRLQNYQLKLKTFISKDIHSGTSEAFTASDMLKSMMTKNPAVTKLITDFNLELE